MEHSSRYLIGIDLGTTNSVVAYIDTVDGSRNGGGLRVFDIPQLTGPGEVRANSALPSFLYFPTNDELASGAVSLPWDEQPTAIVGVMAREQGALTPARQVSSAKSWLSHGGVDRRARILPRDAEPSESSVSPVEASAQFLLHLRNAWNQAYARDASGSAQRFEKQEIVLTVPASFDEEARELTVEAARAAGLQNLTLLEEPLAAFYSWIATHRDTMQQQLHDGNLVLICDIGGGTTDFSLVRAHVHENDVQFERTAIGEHLLLGGDNLDFALARKVEEKLKGAKLTLRQRQALRRACSSAKERLLSDDSIDHLPISILGAGRAVVGQMLATELTRAEVIDLLTAGFLPLTKPHDLPVRGRSAGLREIGLPYASDPAITKHLAAFLAQAATAMRTANNPAPSSTNSDSEMARPDAILFNGGFCTPPLVRERIADAIANWFVKGQESREIAHWRSRILPNAEIHTAVARGAAYYGRVRRGAEPRIRAGSARTYYIGLRSVDRLQGVCVLPAGADEGTTLPLDRDFAVLANRPVSFTLYSSRVRHDPHGAVATLDSEDVHRHAPLVTLLRYGKKLREVELSVRLRAIFTEVGALELWCESLNSEHRWRLQFELRGHQAEATEAQEAVTPPQLESPAKVAPHSARTGSPEVSSAAVESATALVRAAFGKQSESQTGTARTQDIQPDTLVSRLEAALGAKRDSWPMSIIRPLCDVLLELANGRERSPRHEVRWLNLVGFCLRPGFGAAEDKERISQLRKISTNGAAFANEAQSEAEWLVLWRRVAGGLNAAHQQELYRKNQPLLGIGSKKQPRINTQVQYEAWRLAASLEHLPANTRASLGNNFIAKLTNDPDDTRWLWSLARLGARIPLYGPLTCVVPVATASEWLNVMLERAAITPEVAFVIVQLARRTGDPKRDIDDALRRTAIDQLKTAGMGESVEALEKHVPPERLDAARMFGESLPPGLHLISSANCLLSVTALTPEPEKIA